MQTDEQSAEIQSMYSTPGEILCGTCLENDGDLWRETLFR